MLIFPYKADVELQRLPLLTLLVCIVCIWVYANQWRSEHAYEQAVERYCAQLGTDERLVMDYLDVPQGTRYCDILLSIRQSPEPQAIIEELAIHSKPTPFYSKHADSVGYVRDVLRESAQRFQHNVPNNLTDRLHFDPQKATLWSSITSAFSHGSVGHVASNLVFFFAFAASVEVISRPCKIHAPPQIITADGVNVRLGKNFAFSSCMACLSEAHSASLNQTNKNPLASFAALAASCAVIARINQRMLYPAAQLRACSASPKLPLSQQRCMP